MSFYYRVRYQVERLVQRLNEPKPRRRTGADFSLAVPFGYTPQIDPLAPRRAAILHIFHPDTAAAIREHVETVPAPFDLYISTDTDEKAESIRATFASWPSGTVEVRMTPNQGRDIAPKLVGMADVYDRYDLVLCLHSKKSVHLGSGAEWRAILMKTLAGSPQTAASILALFEADPRLGLVFPQHYQAVREWIEWGKNRADAGRLADRMGFDLESARALDFVSGSMFWARTAALRPLLALNLSVEDFPAEAGQIDGTLAHAIERLFVFVAEHAGFGWLKIADRELYRRAPNLLKVDRPEDLARAMKRARVRFLPAHDSLDAGAKTGAP